MHTSSILPLLVVLPAVLSAQVRDSAVALPDISVSVTRTPAKLNTLGAAVTVIDSAALHRNRITPGLDEALATVPGLVIGNRWNYSLDQRLSIRGFGARANFGWRGVKVLIDGVPQTLPDGQSQLWHLDLSLVNRVEVLRGAASSQYGNASGGVISFSTIGASAQPSLSLRAESGTLGTSKFQAVGSGLMGDVSGTISLSRFFTDGLRDHSSAEQRRLNAGADWHASETSRVTLRISHADDPTADNPGALTENELKANRDSAAGNNIRRDAGKAVKQSQVALGYHYLGNRLQVEAVTWGLSRTLDNPLAAPPPAPAAPNEGTWVGIDRRVAGARAAVTMQHGALVTTFGADAQLMRDERSNERSVAGVPNGVTLLDQQERVVELGPFANATLTATPDLRVSAGARWDAVSFSVVDHLAGTDRASRSMNAASANVGLSWSASPALTAWTSVATSFETPTTTELSNQPDGQTGLNKNLDPQRSTSTEIGVRGRRGNFSLEVAGWSTATRSAIIPALDNGGRTYYQNAGKTSMSGLEAGLQWRATSRLRLQATGTLTKAQFGEYVSVTDGNLNLKGNRLAGLPRSTGRVGAIVELGRGISLDVDQTLRSTMFADDKNLVEVAGLGSGITGARLAWRGHLPSGNATISLAVLNAFDKEYIGAVTINGAGGRVFEPAAGRTVTVGVEVRW